MKQIVLNIQDSEYRFFRKMIKNFSFVEIDEKANRLLELEAKLSKAKKLEWQSIKDGLLSASSIEQGEENVKFAHDFLNEL
jgi:hypothetical protein